MGEGTFMVRDQDRVLMLLGAEPGLDDVEIAERLGLDPFDISLLLRKLEREGLIQESKTTPPTTGGKE